MNIKDLQYYISLTQLKKFSEVAQKFHVSQPTISAAIQRLEAEVGSRLIIRGNPHLPLKLTTSGEQTLIHGQNILREYQLLQQEIAHNEAGQLVIGMPPIIEITYFPRVASRLPQELFKQIQPISQGSLAALAGLKNGQLDLAFLGYLDDFTDSSISLHEFDQQPFSIVVPQNHPLAQKKSISFQTLRNQNFIVLKNNFVHRQAFQRITRINHMRPNIIFESNEIQSVLNMVAHKMGIALLSNSVILDNPNLVRIPLNDTNLPTFKVGLAYRTSMKFSPGQTKLLNAIKTAFN